MKTFVDVSRWFPSLLQWDKSPGSKSPWTGGRSWMKGTFVQIQTPCRNSPFSGFALWGSRSENWELKTEFALKCFDVLAYIKSVPVFISGESCFSNSSYRICYISKEKFFVFLSSQKMIMERNLDSEKFLKLKFLQIEKKPYSLIKSLESLPDLFLKFF